jgi:hypothetical protein
MAALYACESRSRITAGLPSSSHHAQRIFTAVSSLAQSLGSAWLKALTMLLNRPPSPSHRRYDAADGAADLHRRRNQGGYSS